MRCQFTIGLDWTIRTSKTKNDAYETYRNPSICPACRSTRMEACRSIRIIPENLKNLIVFPRFILVGFILYHIGFAKCFQQLENFQIHSLKINLFFQ